MQIRLAVFTNQFPGKVNTFFARDIVTLINYGFCIDIFPIYPIQENYWQFVPKDLRDIIQKKTKIKFLPPIHFFKNNSLLLKDIDNIITQSKKFGITQYLKSYYVVRQATLWARYFDGYYDYMLSYWGNYAATYGFLANKALSRKVPFSFFLHAGTDLYRDQIYLEQKIQYASKVFTVCEFNMKFLQSLYADTFETFKHKLVLYHLGIDLNDLPFQSNFRDDSTLLTIGSFVPQKGFMDVVEALSLLASEFETIKLIMIGDGPERKNIQNVAKKLGLEDRIVFTGLLPFEIVKRYLQKCTILVHPSSELGDAVPTVIKEALASGLPVIASTIAGIPELVDYGKSGVLIPPTDRKTLAAAIRGLLLDSERRLQLAHNGRAYAESRFDIWKNGEHLCKQLELDLN